MAFLSLSKLSPVRKAQVIAACVFLIDVVTPQGMVPYMFYAIAVFMAARARQREPMIMLGYVCTLMTAAGAAFSPGEASFETIVYNRIFGTMLIWTMVVLCLPSERRKGDRR